MSINKILNMTAAETSTAIGTNEVMDDLAIDMAIDQQNEHDAAVDAIEFSIDELVKSAETASLVMLGFEAAQESGSIDKSAVIFANAAMDNAFAKYGVEAQTASLESLDEANGQDLVISTGLEAVKDKFKQAWDWVVKQLKALRNAIAAFYTKHFSQVGRLSKALKSIAKKAEDTKGAPKEKQVEPANAQYLDGATVNDVPNLNFAVKSMFNKAFIDASNTAADALAAAAEGKENVSAADLKEAITAAHTGYSEAVAKLFQLTDSDKSKEPRLSDFKGEVLMSKAGIGNGRVVLKKQEGEADTVVFLSPEAPAKGKAIKLDALTPSMVNAWAVSAAAVADSVVAKQKEAREDVLEKSISKAGKALQKLLDKESTKEAKAEANTAMKSLLAFEKNMNTVNRDLNKHINMVLKAVAAYTQASLKNLKKADA